MSKNMTRKGLAFGAGLSLVATGLATVPAQAAAGDLVNLGPSVGSNTGIFISDEFVLQSFASTQINTTEFAVKIDNPDQDVLKIDLKVDDDGDGFADALTSPDTVDLNGFTSTGAYVTIASDFALNGGSGSDDGIFVIDMDAAGIVSLVISDIEGLGDADNLQVGVQPIASVSDAGVREVQTFGTLTVANATAYVLNLPTEAAVTYTSDADATIAEIAAGLDALISAQDDSAVISADGADLVVTYHTAGNVGNAVLLGALRTITPDAATDGNGADTPEDATYNALPANTDGATYTLTVDDQTVTTTGLGLAATVAALDAIANADVVDDGGGNITVTHTDDNADVDITLETDRAVVTETTAGTQADTPDVLIDFTVENGVSLINGAFDFDASDAADVATELAYGAGDKSVVVTTWVESDAPLDFDDVDAAYASKPVTLTWYDPKGVVVVPRIERINTNLNDQGDNMTATVEFNKPINLDMFDSAMWDMQVTTPGVLPTFAVATDLADNEIEIAGLGVDAVNADNFGRYAFSTGQLIALNTTYTLNIHNKLTEAATGVERWFSSTGYSIAAGTADDHLSSEPTITDTADVDFTATAADTEYATASIRSGVKSVTYVTQLRTDDADDNYVDTKVASVPMLAIVTNGAFMPTGSSITVAGNPSAMTLADEVRIVTGFSNADGQFSVTVNSAVANKNESYTVQFFVLDETGNFNGEVDEEDGNELAKINASYSAADAGATSLTAVNSVVAGEEVTVSFTVTDQFGEPISATAAGKALNISLAAPNTDNLNEALAVPASGEVSFTFTNYLAVGGSDLLTATLYTGTASDPTTVDTAVVTLYNTGATGAIQVPESLTGVITYVDYIPNGEKETAANPDPVNDIVFTGTVVDANGVGIPAAVVTIDAPGMQIQDGTRYYLDTRTTNANAAGVFSVNLNAHTVNTTGATVTVTTADGKTASTLVKTYLPSAENGAIGDDTLLNGNNLQLTVDMPETIVMNQTYAVTAKLTDKWGNPVKTSDNAVDFTGTGSIQVNGVSTPIAKDFDKNGEALVYIRSVKDIAGPGTLEVAIEDADYTSWTGAAVKTNTTLDFATQATVDVATTDWDETLFESTFTTNVEVLETAPAATPSADQKVNAGSFKGYVALYAKGYAGQRMSAKVGNDWVVVPVLASNFERVVEFTGAGYTVAVRIYIDRVLIDTITVTTK